MNSSRRKFLKKTMLAAAGTTLFSQVAFASRAKKVLGLQLYTVRDDMKKNPVETLKQVAAIGYRNVEHANYVNRKFYGFSAVEFKKLLDSMGLNMISGHTSLSSKHWDAEKKDFTDEWKWTVEDASTLGQHYVVSPSLDESLRNNYEGLMQFLDVFNKCGELCKKSGMQFGYHNHNFEFSNSINGTRVFDLILQHTDPSLVAQQLDIGNMYGVGGRAMDVIKQYPGRFELMHVKDEIKSNKGEMSDGYESTIISKGILGVKEILATAESTGGTTQFIIEQESYQGKTPVDCAKEDFEVMKSWNF